MTPKVNLAGVTTVKLQMIKVCVRPYSYRCVITSSFSYQSELYSLVIIGVYIRGQNQSMSSNSKPLKFEYMLFSCYCMSCNSKMLFGGWTVCGAETKRPFS